jgi:branched-chain amino acid transport system substrate-binding protein
MNDVWSVTAGRRPTRRPGRCALALAAATTVAAVTLSACAHDGSGGSASAASGGSSGSTFNVGLIASMTGAQAQIGQDSRNGAQLAADEINASGGLLGHKISLSAEDDASLPSTGVSAAQKLTDSGNLNALLGPDISAVLEAVSPTVARAKIPWIVSGISPKDFEMKNPWGFGGRPTDAVNAQIMANYAAKTLKVHSTVIIYNLDAYAEPTLPSIEQDDKAAGVKVVRVQGIQDGATSATSQVEAAVNSGAQSIEFWGLLPEAALTLKTVKSLGFKGPVFGANALVNATTLQLAGPAADGAIAATTFVPTNPAPQIQNFVTKYKAQYHAAPDDHGALYYDMMNLLAAAVKKAGSTDPDKIRAALAGLKYNGVDGPISFSSAGADVAPSGVIAQAQNGQAKVVQFLNATK